MKPNPELTDDDNPEWTHEMFARARPASEMLPEIIGPEAAAALLKPRGRPKALRKKTPVSIRLDEDVVKAFKAKGKGWQSRMNDALREWLREHPAA
jgi:uncharacterized protein (DUF4415 family)